MRKLSIVPQVDLHTTHWNVWNQSIENSHTTKTQRLEIN